MSENVTVVIGAGPVGLAAAAHLQEQGLPFVVLEAGPSAGAAVAAWGHVRLFSPLLLAKLAEQEPGTRITWAMRGGSIDRTDGGGDADALPGRGALGSGIKLLVDSGRITLVTGFAVNAIRDTGSGFELCALDGRTLTADRVVAATGFRPDHRIAEEMRLDLDPALGCTRALAPLIDPNEHSCGTVRPHGVDELTQPEPNYYAVGMKSYGRAPTFLMATGYEQVRSIAAALAGDWAAARDVRLDLPDTGVCSSTAGYEAMLADGDMPAPQLIELIPASGGGCCG